MLETETSKASAVPPIFGRAEAVTEVDRTLERTRTGSGEGLLLSGEDGSGKSLFFRTTIQRARHRGFRVLDGRALPEEIPQPFSLVRDLVRSGDWRPRPDRAEPEPEGPSRSSSLRSSATRGRVGPDTPTRASPRPIPRVSPPCSPRSAARGS